MNIIELSNYLRSEDADFDDVYETGGKIAVSIEWGDWKHSHLRANYLMKQLGYVLVNEELTNSDGSDCYSSIHFYKQQEL